jgi:hypothetical protein
METRLFSYDELGELLGVKAESARKTAQRKRWQRVRANDGTVKVAVPVDEMPEPETKAGPVADESRMTIAVLESQIDGLKQIVAAERQRAEAESKRADAAESRLTAVEADRDAWRTNAGRPWYRRLVG